MQTTKFPAALLVAFILGGAGLVACGGGSGGDSASDTTPPTLNIGSSVSTLKGGATTTITFSFSEAPSGFTASDIRTSGGALSGLAASSADPKVYTATFTAGSGNGTASITVAAGSYTDAAGNAGAAGASPSLAVDTIAPTVAIQSDSATLVPGASSAITFTFSEDPSSSFTWNGSTGSVVVSGGSLGAIAGDGLTRTATFTAGNTNGAASITVPVGAYTDTVGNPGAAGTSPSLTVSSGVSRSPSVNLGSNTSGGTSGVGCALAYSGSQLLSYAMLGSSSTMSESLNYLSNWACAGTRTLAGNAVPNHATTDGKFASRLSAQTISKTFPVNPSLAASATTLQIPGYLLNSVKLEPGTAGKCTTAATSVRDGCDYAGTSGAVTMEVLQDPSVTASTWWDFGADTSNAHVQPNGEYHYHGMPNLLIPKLNTNSANSMTLVGWAMDGFPIYADKGYATANDATSALKSMKGSYRLKTTGVRTQPSSTYFPLGMFVVDWEYVAGLGDLDECNGRTGVTPEFPNGTYHYYITSTYPFIQRCTKGSK
ncbi:MAG: YHYH protein [Rhodoferax sp.]|nr:YHYH protein [Rhodoferax sp.]